MKKTFRILFAVLFVFILAFSVTACTRINSGADDVDNAAMVKSISGGTVDGLNIYLEVSPDTNQVDLSGKLTCSKNSSWQLYEDVTGQTLVPTKYATDLESGENVYYVVVNSADDKINRTYTLTIWKNYYVTVTWKSDGYVYQEDEVSTHSSITPIPISREGYNDTE